MTLNERMAELMRMRLNEHGQYIRGGLLVEWRNEWTPDSDLNQAMMVAKQVGATVMVFFKPEEGNPMVQVFCNGDLHGKEHNSTTADIASAICEAINEITKCHSQ